PFRPLAVTRRKAHGSSFTDQRSHSVMQLHNVANQSGQVQRATQLQALANRKVLGNSGVVQRKDSLVNNTGLPHNLKSGIESLSGHSMDDVKVHYNSDKPAQLNAHAYAQGTDIHLASGQERHLPHEAWHVVQQKQGRVQPTMQMKGAAINDNAGLEREADVMGLRAGRYSFPNNPLTLKRNYPQTSSEPIQRQVNSFASTTATVDVPGEQVTNQAKAATEINATGPQIDAAVKTKFTYISGSAPQVQQIKASIKKGRPNGAGAGTSKTAEVGAFGRDEMILRRNYADLGFEGGHLVPRAVWDANDTDVAKMNGYENLVPMSRGMNIYAYMKGVEEKMMINAYRKWTITPNQFSYQIPEKQVAQVLGLPLKPGKDGDNLLTFKSWIPKSVSANRAGFASSADESGIYQEVTQADNKLELIALLTKHNLVQYLTEDLKNDIATKLP
ncbi:MAG: DUF4157 domain-containing protein, partial [Bacteroidota bacterium]